MKKVALFIKHYSIGKSSPIICLIDLLSDCYDGVDIYVQDVWCTNAAVLTKENVRLIEVPDLGTGFRGMFNRLWSLVASRYHYEDDYMDIFCFDPHGLILCSEVFPGATPFYYSLELYFRENHYNLPYSRWEMRRDRALIHSIRGLIIQSEEREGLFRREYGLSSEINTFILPVTYQQQSCTEKRSHVREKYGIGRDKKVALHLGGIQGYFSCIEIALAFSRIEDWVMIFHGYYFGEYIEHFKAMLQENRITNVIISDEYFEFIEDMDPLLMSCDLGIAWYNDLSPNFTTSGRSSGKISAYLRFGLPVVANRYPSTESSLEQTGCGICVDTFAEIKDAVERIASDYRYYSDNCIKEYDRVYWFENYRESLTAFISGSSGHQSTT